MSFFDFNSASEQTSFDLIPKGALVRVRIPGPCPHDGQTRWLR